MDELKEIQRNWEAERCINPEDVDYLLERIEGLNTENLNLYEQNAELMKFFRMTERYEQSLKRAKEEVAMRSDEDIPDNDKHLAYRLGAEDTLTDIEKFAEREEPE